MIRLFAFDLDGTTITEHRYLSSGNREALRLAAERGVVLVPTTGRMKDFVPEEISTFPGVRYLITSNGAMVYDVKTGEALFQRLIPNKKALEVQAVLNDYDVYVEYYRGGRAITKTGYPELAISRFGLPEDRRLFVESKDYTFTENFSKMLQETGLCPEKINLPYLREGVREELWDKLKKLGGLLLTSSIVGNLELNAEDANKGAALLELGKYLDIPPEEIMAIGDNGNDVSMLLAAGCSLAVGDGSPEALQAAKYRTAPHDRDGVAEAVRRFILA